MTTKELPVTLSVEEAGKRYFNLSRNGSYAAAYRGELGVLIRVGSRLRVVTAGMERKMAEAANGRLPQPAPPQPAKPRARKKRAGTKARA